MFPVHHPAAAGDGDTYRIALTDAVRVRPASADDYRQADEESVALDESALAATGLSTRYPGDVRSPRL